jgi:hypothetical protein
VQQIHDAPHPLKSIERASYVPDPIASVVMQNLSKKPEERVENAGVLGRAILEAAVASGLSAQEILSRPAMLSGGRAPHSSVVQMPSMLRTKQMQLGAEDAARVAGVPSAHAGQTQVPEGEVSRVTKTAYLTPAPGATDASAAGPSHGGRTQVRTEIAEPEALPPGVETAKWTPPADFGARLVPPPPPSGVDLTMDDANVPAPTPSRTAPPSSGSSSSSAVTSPPSSRTAPPSTRTAPPASRPGFSKADTTFRDETSDIAAAQQTESGRSLMLVVACFLVGAVAMGGIAYKMGLVGGRAPAAHPVVAIVPPPPASDVGSADPSGPVAGPTPVSVAPIPPLAVDRASARASGTTAGAARAVIDVSSGRPAVGQPVDLVGRLVGGHPSRVDGARFHISGPGIAPGTDISAVDDGSGTYRASFTFLQPGRFEIDFGVRADGSAARAARLVVVGDPRTAPAAAAPTDVVPPAPAPAPSPSGKWM